MAGAEHRGDRLPLGLSGVGGGKGRAKGLLAERVKAVADATEAAQSAAKALEEARRKLDEIGIGRKAAEEKLTLGTVVLNLKELIASTKPNRRLLRSSYTDLERMLRDDLQTALNLRAELGAIRGACGVENGGHTTAA